MPNAMRQAQQAFDATEAEAALTKRSHLRLLDERARLEDEIEDLEGSLAFKREKLAEVNELIAEGERGRR